MPAQSRIQKAILAPTNSLLRGLIPTPVHSPTSEITNLTPEEEVRFQQWGRRAGIGDLNDPRSHYDYRGYWKNIASKGQDAREVNALDQRLHFPDTWKQHGGETFSIESQYSRGPWDGVTWVPRIGIDDSGALQNMPLISPHSNRWARKTGK